MLSENESKALIEQIQKYAKLPKCELEVKSSEDAFIRFANNGITTSGFRVKQQVSITSGTDDKRSGNAVVSELTPDALRRGVEQAESLARISRPDPESMPALGPQSYPKLKNFDDRTFGARNDVMITHVKAMIDGAISKELVAAGFIQRNAQTVAVGNKAGLFGYHRYTEANLSNTFRTKDGASSGWAGQTSTQLADLNGEAAAQIALRKCLDGVAKSGARKRLEPGKYTVILEPAGVSDLIGYLGFSMAARDAEQGQSFLSKDNGTSKLGEKLFPEHITLRSDPFNSKLSALPWGPELLPNEATPWIEKGVVKNMFWDRYWASKAGKQPTPYPANLTLDGQDASLDDLIKGTERGLLITRLWYIRVLQPQTLQVTGLTRDGVFLVENGKITDPVMNFRWNESPVRVLQNTKHLGKPVPVVGAEAGASFSPPLVATDFTMASVSDAV